MFFSQNSRIHASRNQDVEMAASPIIIVPNDPLAKTFLLPSILGSAVLEIFMLK